MAKNKNILEFRIPNWALCALINGDYSGMDEQDEAKLNSFIDKIVRNHGNAHFMLSDEQHMNLGFCYVNDIDNLGSDCSKLLLLPTEYTQDENKVLRALKKSNVTTNACSPNLVAETAFNAGISLKSEQVVRISNNYYK